MTKTQDIGARKWFSLVAIVLAAIAFSLDLTVLNLALPTLARSLHASTNQLQWISDSYALALAVLTLPAGMLGDRFGRKKFMLLALAIFGAASLWCAYAGSVGSLIGARLLLGLGAAFILPLALSVVPVFFTDDERPRAIAAMMGGVFLAYPLGPILGGWLLTRFWWGSVFLVNVPIVLIALITVALLLPESKSREQHKIDFAGIGLSSLGLIGITYGAIEAEVRGWSDSRVLASLVGGAVLLGLFVAWEKRMMRRGRQPLVDLHLFGSSRFAWGTVLMTFVNFAMFGLLFGLPQYLQAVRGEDALDAGYHLLAMIGGLVVGSVIVSKMARQLGPKVAVGIGFAIMAFGLLLGTRTTLDASNLFTVVWVAVTGLGLGFAMPSTADTAIGALSAERSGAGNATITAIRQVGGTLGIALLGTLMGARYRSGLHHVQIPAQAAAAVKSGVNGGVAVANQLGSASLLHDVRAAFVHGLDSMLWVCGGIAIVACLLAVLFLPRQRATKKVVASRQA